MTNPAHRPGDRVCSRIHRPGILAINPGDIGIVTATGLRNYTEPYVLVTLHVASGVIHTSFTPAEIDKAP